MFWLLPLGCKLSLGKRWYRPNLILHSTSEDAEQWDIWSLFREASTHVQQPLWFTPCVDSSLKLLRRAIIKSSRTSSVSPSIGRARSRTHRKSCAVNYSIPSIWTCLSKARRKRVRERRIWQKLSDLSRKS